MCPWGSLTLTESTQSSTSRLRAQIIVFGTLWYLVVDDDLETPFLHNKHVLPLLALGKRAFSVKEEQRGVQQAGSRYMSLYGYRVQRIMFCFPPPPAKQCGDKRRK